MAVGVELLGLLAQQRAATEVNLQPQPMVLVARALPERRRLPLRPILNMAGPVVLVLLLPRLHLHWVGHLCTPGLVVGREALIVQPLRTLRVVLEAIRALM